MEKTHCKNASIQTKIKETDAIKHVKVGSRTGNIFNLLEGDLKTAIKDVSIDQTEDSHPDLQAEEREANNALKFKLDCVQMRAFEGKTVSNIVKVYK